MIHGFIDFDGMLGGRMAVSRGVLVAWASTTLLQQPVGPPVRVAPPAPCTGDSTETHVRRAGMIAVPNLDDMTVLRARTTLATVGLKIDIRSVRIDGPTGIVFGQAPPPGSFAAAGDLVIVCTRRPSVFPYVVGMSFDAARTTLQNAGYETVRLNSFVDRGSRVGVVGRQQPTAGVAAPRGSVDTLIVGLASDMSANVTPPTQPSRGDSAVPRATAALPPIVVVDSINWMAIAAWVVAIGGLLAIATAAIKRKDKRLLAGLRVSPHSHPGNPTVIDAGRDD
ncbi:MAG: PASTA domain-containing protein [bacterium]